jgi:hypothetical protein
LPRTARKERRQSMNAATCSFQRSGRTEMTLWDRLQEITECQPPCHPRMIEALTQDHAHSISHVSNKSGQPLRSAAGFRSGR